MKPMAIVSAMLFAMVVAQPGARAEKAPTKQEKVNTYVGMLNTWSSTLQKSSTTYLAWADAKTGPTCKEKGITGPSSFGDTAEAQFNAIVSTLAKGPKLAVDAEAIAMAKALLELREPSTLASTYYFKREYKKDDCKLGKELHPKLMAAWAAYFKNEAVVRTFVAEYNAKLAVTELAATKKRYGEKIRYHFEKMRIDGKTLVDVIDQELATDKPNSVAIQAALDAFKATQEATLALYDKERADKKSKIAGVLYQGGFSQYAGYYGKNLVSATDSMLTALGKPTKSKSDESSRQKSIKYVFDAYNDMVNGGNKVAFSKQVK